MQPLYVLYILCFINIVCRKVVRHLLRHVRKGKRREVRDLLRRKDVKPDVTHVGIHNTLSMRMCGCANIGALDTTASG